MRREQFHQETQNYTTFYQTSVTNAQCISGAENNFRCKKKCEYGHGKFSRTLG